MIIATILLVTLQSSCAMSRRINQSLKSDSGDDASSDEYDLFVPTSRSDSGIGSLDSTIARHDSLSDGFQDEDSETQTIKDILTLAPQATIETSDSANLLIGKWVGQTWQSHSDGCLQSTRVVMQIAASNDDNSLFGSIVFGEGDGPPPVTDPEVGYPTDVNFNQDFSPCLLSSPFDGFPYTIYNGRITENGRFIFRIIVVEFYEAWCSLQTSYVQTILGSDHLFYSCMPDLSEDERFACGKSAASNEGFVEPLPIGKACPIDRGKFTLCSVGGSAKVPIGVCICMKDGCVANIYRTIQIELAFEDGILVGFITNLEDGLTPMTEVKLRPIEESDF